MTFHLRCATMVWCLCAAAGCVGPLSARSDVGHPLQKVRLYLPLNYLAGAPWPVDVLSGKEALSALRQEYVFRAEPELVFSGAYTLRSFCKEISRATGKRLIWIPDRGEELLAARGRRWVSNSPLQRGDIQKTPYGRVCRRPLYAVLSHLAFEATEDLEEADNNPCLWSVWLGRDNIFLVRLPRAHDTQPAEPCSPATGHAPVPGWEHHAEDILAVLPQDPLTGVVLQPALLPPAAHEARLAQKVRVSSGSHSCRTLSQEVTRSTGMPVVWWPDPAKIEGGDKIYDGPFKPTEYAAEQAGGSPQARVFELPLREILESLIGDATECGIAWEPPDREVWVALLGQDAVYLLMLPDRGW